MESTTSKQYVVWMRWGRVGKVGQVSIERLTDINKAKHIFEKKFKDKTANDWAEKDEFVKEYGKYDLIVNDYDTSSNESVDPTLKKTSATDSTSVDEKPIVAKSKLHKSIQELIEMICNVQEMESMLKEMKYDAKKAPLGKLGKNQIKAGYAALKEIEALIKANKTSGILYS
jgi:poly [ADP-ribose] polymerase